MIKSNIIRLKAITNSPSTRIDPPFQLSDGVTIRRLIKESPYSTTTIGEETERIWHAGRWKRAYVAEPSNGIPLIGSSAMLRSDLSNVKLVSKKYTDDIQDKLLESGWILVSCSGTIGNTVFTNTGHAGKLASQDVLRLKPKDILGAGYVYAYLSSKYGYAMLTQGTFGAVIQHIEPEHVAPIPIPILPKDLRQKIDDLIWEASHLREDADAKLKRAQRLLKQTARIRDLNSEDYNYFGTHNSKRAVSCFVRNRKDISTTSFNAFNHGERFRKTLSELDECETILIKDALNESGWASPGGVEVIELRPGNGVMLINQKDIFDIIIQGKWVPKKKKYSKDYLKYGEVLIAKIGTLGENETFCRCVFVGEELEGKLISSAFYKLSTNDRIPSGYLYCWLSSDWGFRQLRSSHFGGKLCYPNPAIMNDYKIPILDNNTMLEIDQMVREAHTMYHKANNKERLAISMVETEIESWDENKSKK